MKAVTTTAHEPGEGSPAATMPRRCSTYLVSQEGCASTAMCAEEQSWQWVEQGSPAGWECETSTVIKAASTTESSATISRANFALCLKILPGLAPALDPSVAPLGWPLGLPLDENALFLTVRQMGSRAAFHLPPVQWRRGVRYRGVLLRGTGERSRKDSPQSSQRRIHCSSMGTGSLI